MSRNRRNNADQLDFGFAEMNVVSPRSAEKSIVMDWRRDAGWNTLESLFGLTARRRVSVTDALGIAAVWICVSVLAQDISKATLRLWRRTGKGARTLVEPKEHAMARILALAPNQEHTWIEFFDMTIRHMALMRNAFVAVRRSKGGDPIEFVPVVPGRVTINVNPETGDKFYPVSRATAFEQAQMRQFDSILTDDEMIHLRQGIIDGLTGYSALTAGADVMALAQAITEYQTRLYDNDAQVRGVFQMKDTLQSEEAFKRLRKQLAEAAKDFRKESKPLLLEGGIEYKETASTSANAETAKNREQQVLEVCRLFRVPPHKAMSFDASKYSNLEPAERAYVSDALIPIAKSIEKRFEAACLSEEDRLVYFLEFDRDEMAALDTKTKAELVKTAVSGGIATVNEGRTRLGYNPIAGGDVRYIPSTFAVVDENNEVVIPAGGQGAVDQNQDTPPADQTTTDAASAAKQHDLRVIQGGK